MLFEKSIKDELTITIYSNVFVRSIYCSTYTFAEKSITASLMRIKFVHLFLLNTFYRASRLPYYRSSYCVRYKNVNKYKRETKF